MSTFPPTGYPPAQQPYVSPPSPAPARAPRVYSVFVAILLAPFSPSLWRDVGQNWRGIGLLYMLLLLILTWTPMMIQAHSGFSKFVQEKAPTLVNQIPPITITNGIASAEAEMPHYIKEPETERTFAIIDTRPDGITELPDDVEALLTQKEFIVRQSGGRMQVHSLAEIESFQLNGARINGWLETARSWFLPLALPLMIVLSLMWRLILMLIAGAIGLGFASAFHARLSFAATMRLSAIAMTPGILLDTILSSIDAPTFGCFGTLFFLGLALAYLAFTIKANATEQPPSGWSAPPGGYGAFPPPPPPLPPA